MKDFFTNLWASFNSVLLMLFYGDNKIIYKDDKPMPPLPIRSNAGKLYDTAFACIGRDMSPLDIAPDALACVESLNGVFTLAFGTPIKKGLLSTMELYKTLKEDFRFEQIDKPQLGCITVAPTGLSTKHSLHGHTGIWGNYDVMSNDSDTGKWKANYTHEAWENVFHVELGFPIYYFKVK